MTTYLDPLCLESFVAVADLRSFRLAAEQVGRTQSTVSGHIARLEQQLGVRLFERTTRSVAFTPAGERLLGDARRLLAIQAAIAGRARFDAVDGPVRFGVSDDLASGHRIAGLAATFTHRHPRSRLSITVGNTFDLADALDQGRLDLVLLKRTEGPNLGAFLWEEPIVWAGAPGFDFERDELPLAVFSGRCVYREAATSALDGAGRRWRIAYESPSHHGLVAAVREGFVISALAQSMVSAELRLNARSDTLPALTSVRVLLAEASRLSKAAQKFGDMVRLSLGERDTVG